MIVLIRQCKFYNLTAFLGGAIYSSVTRGEIEIRDSIFEGNVA